MKRTRKLILALVVVMSLLMAMAVAIIPASAASTDGNGKTYIYADVSFWDPSSARFAAYFFGDNGNTWVSMTNHSGSIYKVEVPEGFTSVIFCRMNKSTTANNWNNKWNQTGNLTVEKAKSNCYYKVSSWDGSDNDDAKWVGHNNTTSTTPATCLTAGSSTTTCSVCGNTSTTEIQATGHSFINEVEYKAAGCSSAGVQAHKQCENCNLYFAGDAAAYATDGVETANGFEIPSTGEHGYTHECDKVCVDCGLLTNPDASHNIEHVEAKAPTCTDNGNIEHWLCTYCGSCWTDAACTQVTNSKNVIISATGHSHEAVVTEPTCIKAGYTTYTCACGDTYTGNATSATGNHVYNELGKCTADADCSYVITYFINANKWSAVSVHCWTDGGASTTWPGNAATKTDVQVNGFDVYSIGVDASKYNKIIFNNNSGKQTMNLDLVVGKYYHGLIGTWFDSTENIPVVSSTKVFLAGSFCDWGTDRCNFVSENGGTVYTLILILPANTTYEFKVVNNGSWLGHSGTFTNDVTNKAFSASTSANCKITTACAGEYVFKFDSSSKKLSVTYPHIGGEATCTAKAKCEVCGKEYGSSLGHNMIIDAAVAPDCLNTGLTEGSHCSRCDYKVAQEIIPALGHNHENCPHKAVVGETYYETLQQAIAGATAGSEIVLNSDIEIVGDLPIENQVIINLNGKTLTAGAVVTFYEGTQFIGEGKLEVAKNSLYNIKGETKYVPVWNAPVLGENDEVVTPGYYTFSEVKDQIKESTVEGTEVVVFRPAFENTEIKKEFVDGAGDNGLSFVISITWGMDDNKVCKEYTLSEELIANVYNAEKPKAIQLGFENWQAGVEYTVTLRIVSGGIYYETTLCTMKDGAITVPEIVTE